MADGTPPRDNEVIHKLKLIELLKVNRHSAEQALEVV